MRMVCYLIISINIPRRFANGMMLCLIYCSE